MEELNLENCMSADEIYRTLNQCSDRTLEELKILGLKEGMNQEELLRLCSLTSDPAYNELVSLNIFGPVLTFDQIMQLCSGTDESGSPNAFGVLAIDTVTPEMGSVPYASVSFGNPVINMYGAGGCVVVTADFQPHNMFEYRRARDILGEWFQKKNDDEFKSRILSFIISPVLLNGAMMTIFHEVVYAQGVPIENNTYRLIMAFDNTQTQEVVASDIRMDDLKKEVESEIARQEAEARMALIQAEQEQKDAEEQDFNPYEESVMQEYLSDHSVDLPDNAESDSASDDDDDDDGTHQNHEWMRFSKD